MKHVDLFCGLGGFALAASRVWGGDYHNIGHSEIEKFPCKIYHKHFPESECLGDISKIRWDKVVENSKSIRCNGEKQKSKRAIRGFGQSRAGDDGGIHLLTGGFPCQPFSIAGKRRGKEDYRSLWHEMFRAIREVKPRYVLAENVTGIESMELENVLADLEGAGYTNCEGETKIIPLIIPACALNAPHRRDRVWIIASYYAGGIDRLHNGEPAKGEKTESAGSSNDAGYVENPRSFGRRGRSNGDSRGSGRSLQTEGSDSDATGPKGEGLEGRDSARFGCPRRCDSKHVLSVEWENKIPTWEEYWYDVALRTCVRPLDDGLPNGLARPKGWRVNALEALGNSIVPAVAQAIMSAIKQESKWIK